MKKVFMIVLSALLLFSSTAMADSVAGKFGITARGGVGYFLNSEFTDAAVANWSVDKTIKGGTGWTGGGGFMYGINDNLSVDFDIIYEQVEVTMTHSGGTNHVFGKGKAFDFSLGAQWRFQPKKAFVPYIGAGVDFLINSFSLYDVYSASGETIDLDNTFGGHLNIGVDYFLTPHVSLNAEFRYLYSTTSDLTSKYPGESDAVVAKYDPGNITGFAGVRFFFP